MKSKLKKLNLPSFIGKAVGLVVGFLVGDWAGAGLGIIIGHSFDFHRNTIYLSVRSFFRKLSLYKSKEQVYRETLFICLGYVAKQNGSISPQEIAAAEALFKRLNLNTVQREAAIVQFNQGKLATDQIDARLDKLRKRFSNRLQRRLDFIDQLINMAYAGGPASDGQLKILYSFLPLLNVESLEFNRLHQQIRERKGYRNQHSYQHSHQQNRRVSEPVLLQAYKTLGVKSTASQDEIKLSYRKLMSIHHPDKLVAQGLTERALEKGKEKAQEIQHAYSVLKKSRSL